MSASDGSSGQTSTEAFFQDLQARHDEPLMRRASGTMRWDLLDGERVEHWYVSIEKGNLDVSHKKAKADTVVRLDRETFDSMARGTVNAVAATLRGDLVPEGDLSLLILFQRLFPSPPPSSTPGAGRRVGEHE